MVRMSSAAPAHHLILVDDDPHILSALRFAFETDGYDVVTFGSGEELLKALPLQADTCLVVDERLPGLSGLEVVARLRSAGVDAPVILVTSNPSALIRGRAAAANIDIVEKPLLDGTLARKVRAAFGGAPAA
jgi:FixJ family two-component response regulator